MDNQTLRAWLVLSHAHALSSTHVRSVLLRLKNPVKLVASIDTHGIKKSIVMRVQSIDSKLDVDHELAQMEKQQVDIITWDTDAYPTLLKEIHDPPPLLYYKGALPEPDRVLVSMVGSRRATHYGREATKRIAGGLSRHGLGIVSGLAFGIDGETHRSTLESGGYTVAVLAGGLDNNNISPSQHRGLANKIVNAGGCLMSEYPIGTVSEAYHFPRRNRIVAGLSRATVVVESTRKSGSLISADCALSENREVCAVPGPINSTRSEGTHQLIRNGATLVTCADDVLEAIDLEASQAALIVSSNIQTNGTEKRILTQLDHEPILIDDLARTLNMPVTELASQLTLLELKRLVQLLPGGYVVGVQS